jgi:hypothetical protein
MFYPFFSILGAPKVGVTSLFLRQLYGSSDPSFPRPRSTRRRQNYTKNDQTVSLEIHDIGSTFSSEPTQTDVALIVFSVSAPVSSALFLLPL